MDIKNELQDEYRTEYNITRKFFELYPEGKDNYKPHPKSMELKPLVSHLVDVFGWPTYIMRTEYLDFANNDYPQPKIESRQDLLNTFEKNYKAGLDTLKNLNLEQLDENWDIRQGEHIIKKWSKYGAIRHAFKQVTHHRAQLGVYYRLNNILVPASYGPSADDESFVN